MPSFVKANVSDRVKPVVRRHKIDRYWCKRCGKLVSAKVPNLFANSPYSKDIHLQVAHLKYGLGLTMDKISALLSEFYGLSVSSGVISGMLTRSGKGLAPLYEELKEAVPRQSVINADETSWRVAGINHWLWSFSSPTVACYHVDRSRGGNVVKLVFGDSFKGVLVSDGHSAYHKMDSAKQKCWVHILRDIKKIEETYSLDRRLITFTKHFKQRIRAATHKIATNY